MADDVRPRGSHHLFRVRSALLDRGQDPLLGRVFEARAALLEHARHETMDLLPHLSFRRRLSEDLEELPVRAFEAPEELVADEFGSHVRVSRPWCYVCICRHSHPLGMPPYLCYI